MVRFAKIVYSWKPWTILAKHSILDFYQGSDAPKRIVMQEIEWTITTLAIAAKLRLMKAFKRNLLNVIWKTFNGRKWRSHLTHMVFCKIYRPERRAETTKLIIPTIR